MNFYISILFFAWDLAAIALAQEGYYWRDYKGGPVPKDAFSGGHDQHGNAVFPGRYLEVCGTLYPQEGKILYESEVKGHWVDQNMMVLCTQNPLKLIWIQVTTHTQVQKVISIGYPKPFQLIPGGTNGNGFLYIGRFRTDNNETLIAKVHALNNELFEAFAGHGLARTTYDLLVYNPNYLSTENTENTENIAANNTSCGHTAPVTVNVYNYNNSN